MDKHSCAMNGFENSQTTLTACEPSHDRTTRKPRRAGRERVVGDQRISKKGEADTKDWLADSSKEDFWPDVIQVGMMPCRSMR